MSSSSKARSGLINSGPYVRLPVEVILDDRLGPDALAIVAYRATFVGQYALHRTALSRKFGLGDDRVGTVFSEAQESGYLQRRHARDGTKAHARVVETLTLPPISSGYAFMRRDWIERLPLRASAAYLFLQARPQGQLTFPRELKDRFDWAPSTTNKWLNSLIDHKLVMRIRRKSANGRFAGFVYASCDGARSNFASAPFATPPDDVFRDHEEQEVENGPTYRGQSSTVSFPSFVSLPLTGGDRAAVADAAAPAVRRDGGQNCYFGGLASWIDSDEPRSGPERFWIKHLSEARNDARALSMFTDEIRRDLLAATAGQINHLLLADDGMEAYEWLVSALAEAANMSSYQAHGHLTAMLSNTIGSRANTTLFSWVYLVKNLLRLPISNDLTDPGSVRLTPAERSRAPVKSAR